MTTDLEEPRGEFDVAWERRDAGFGARLFRTLGAAFSPARSAASMGGADVEPAFRFLWLSAIPLAMLAGIIPHTRTLVFGDLFGVKLVAGADTATVVLDVGRAMLVQVCQFVVDFLAVSMPFSSLVKAYAPPHGYAAALRVLCYRGWLIPASALLYAAIAWGVPGSALPADTGEPPDLPAWLGILLVMPFWLHAFLWVGMWFAARRACQLGGGMATLVTFIPFVLWSVLQPFEAALIKLVLPVAPGG